MRRRSLRKGRREIFFVLFCFVLLFFQEDLSFTHGTRENEPPMGTKADMGTEESLPLILSVCSADQEATVSEQRNDGGEESDRGYMKVKRKCTKKSS